MLSKIPEQWTVSYRELTFRVRPTGFKHTGLFPEQAANWDWMSELIRGRTPAGARAEPVRVYRRRNHGLPKCRRGGLPCGRSQRHGARAKENAQLSGLTVGLHRYIVDDALKFVLREQRRGKQYEGILMDPPSYGRGRTGRSGNWKMRSMAW